jgi:hypothetical protein
MTDTMTTREAERRQRQRNKEPRQSQRILSFRQWCALNSFSEATGRRLIRKGKVKVVRLSERRIGISESDNCDYQQACAKAGE